MAFFFRDPERAAPVDAAGYPRAGGRQGDGGARRRWMTRSSDPPQAVSIFLSPLDVHVNRSPLAGLVVGVEHRPGPSSPRTGPEASERNERTTIADPGGRARAWSSGRSPACWRAASCAAVQPGDRLASGQRFGLIKFGSRTDLIVPAPARALRSRSATVSAGRDRDGSPPVRRRPSALRRRRWSELRERRRQTIFLLPGL